MAPTHATSDLGPPAPPSPLQPHPLSPCCSAWQGVLGVFSLREGKGRGGFQGKGVCGGGEGGQGSCKGHKENQ